MGYLEVGMPKCAHRAASLVVQSWRKNRFTSCFMLLCLQLLLTWCCLGPGFLEGRVWGYRAFLCSFDGHFGFAYGRAKGLTEIKFLWYCLLTYIFFLLLYLLTECLWIYLGLIIYSASRLNDNVWKTNAAFVHAAHWNHSVCLKQVLGLTATGSGTD